MDGERQTTFTSPATNRCPKIYVFASAGDLLYVGQTVQGMSARMRLGFQADGTGGYHGYRWRNVLSRVECHVWCLVDLPEDEELHALECIESEVVFGYRQKYDQWPKYQTEIHFHESSAAHRALAAHVLSHFPGKAAA
jgi:hypothetical protein